MTDDPPELSIELLEELERQWRVQGAPLVAGLAPGLTDTEIDALTEPIGLRLPAEPRLWWRWHDGAAPNAKLKIDREMGAPGYEAWSLCQGPREFLRCDHENSPPVIAGLRAAIASRWARMR